MKPSFIQLAVAISASTLLLLITYYLYRGARFSREEGVYGYIIVSLLFSLFASSIVILLVAGFIPFLNGFRPAWWVIIVLFLMYPIPLIGRVEVFGNVIIDPLFISLFITATILLSASGINEFFHRRLVFDYFKAWLILSMALTIITVSLLRVFLKSKWNWREK